MIRIKSLLATTAVAALAGGTGVAAQSTEEGDAASTPVQLDEVVVTGTNLKGRPPLATVTLVDRQQVERGGFLDAGEVLRTIPQNFAGGVNNEGRWGSADDQAVTLGGQAGANLYGLGSGSTLVLMNGQRLPVFGRGLTSDISAVPASMIQRMEVLSDGASAIYGADAVAGVVNVITRTRYDGVEVRGGYGAASDGYETATGSLLAGGQIGSFSLVASVDAARQSELWSYDRSLTRSEDPSLASEYTLMPDMKRTSYMLSLNGDLTSRTRIAFNSLYQDRDISGDTLSTRFYSTTTNTQSKQYYLSGSSSTRLTDQWTATLDGALGGNESRYQSGFVIGAGAPVVNTAVYENRLALVDARIEGGLVRLPAGKVAVALGASHRWDRSEGVVTTAALGAIGGPVRQEVFSQYAELSLPFVAADQGVPLVHSLDMSLALRRDDYSDVGDRTSPRIAVRWRPVSDLALTASYSESFRPATPFHRNAGYGVYGAAVLDNVPGGTSNALVISGVGGPGATDLKPETSENRTISLLYRPERWSPLEIGLQYYDFDYDDRLAYPDPGSIWVADIRNAPSSAVRRGSLSQSEFDALVGGAQSFYDTVGGDGPNAYTALVDARLRNVASSRVSGLVGNISGGVDVGRGRLDLTATVNHTLVHDYQLTRDGPSESRKDIIYYPASWRGRLEALWTVGAWSASTAWNHTGSYLDNRVLGEAVEIEAWSTFDASLQYSASSARGGMWAGLHVMLTASNLFDTAPPEIRNGNPGSTNQRYDPTNASVIGRVLRLEVVKSW